MKVAKKKKKKEARCTQWRLLPKSYIYMMKVAKKKRKKKLDVPNENCPQNYMYLINVTKKTCTW